MAMKFKLKRIAGLPLVGLGTKAVNEYEEIPVDSLEPALRMAALEAGRQLRHDRNKKQTYDFLHARKVIGL